MATVETGTCSHCLEAEYQTSTTSVGGVGDVECLRCPKCDYVVFTQAQSDRIDRLRLIRMKDELETRVTELQSKMVVLIQENGDLHLSLKYHTEQNGELKLGLEVLKRAQLEALEELSRLKNGPTFMQFVMAHAPLMLQAIITRPKDFKTVDEAKNKAQERVNLALNYTELLWQSLNDRYGQRVTTFPEEGTSAV